MFELKRLVTSRVSTDAVDEVRPLAEIYREHRFGGNLGAIDRLRDEAPATSKDIRSVLHAQRDLVKVTRVLRPVLNDKGVSHACRDPTQLPARLVVSSWRSSDRPLLRPHLVEGIEW